MKIRKSHSIFIASALIVGVLSLCVVPSTVFAYACGKDSEGNDVTTSINFNCNTNGNNQVQVTAIILWVINLLSAGVGVAVVVGIMFGGFMYITSGGDAQKTKQGKDMIKNAIIALFLFVFLWAIANFLVPGGLFH